MAKDRNLEERVQRLEDRFELQRLVSVYGQYADDRDVESLIALYADDGVYDSKTGPVTGREELRRYYEAQLTASGVTYHYPHSHIVESLESGIAAGTVHAHAELDLGGTTYIVAVRYADQYVKRESSWYFARREAKPLYALPFADLGHGLADDRRIRWPDSDPQVARVPEGLASWQAFWKDIGTS